MDSAQRIQLSISSFQKFIKEHLLFRSAGCYGISVIAIVEKHVISASPFRSTYATLPLQAITFTQSIV